MRGAPERHGQERRRRARAMRPARLDDREREDQAEVLVHEADAELAEQTGRQRDRAAALLELTVVRGVEARQDLDHDLPEPFSPSRPCTSPARPEVDGVQGLDAAEVLGEPASGQRGRPSGRPRIGVGVYWSPQSSR